MEKLTDEQVDRAARAGSKAASDLGFPDRLATSTEQEQKEMAHKVMRAAAPYLQLSWDEMDYDEIAEASRRAPFDAVVMCQIINNFIEKRNSALKRLTVNPVVEDIHRRLGGVTLTKEDAQAITSKVYSCTRMDEMYRDSMLYPDTSKIPQPREPMRPGGKVYYRGDNIPDVVDPRLSAIMAAIRKRDWPLDLEHEVELADNIIKALDNL